MSQAVPLVHLSEVATEKGYGDSLLKIALRRIRHDTLTMIALVVLLTLTALSVLAPVIANAIHIDPDQVTDSAFSPPGVAGHLLGTDDVGRDHFIRLLYAGQISLGIATIASILSLVVGISVGVATGYYRGLFDDLMNWFITTIDSIPSLYLLLLLASVFRPSPTVMILVLGLLGWTGTMRLVRGETLSLREREFVLAARSIGVPTWRIMFVHIVPNVLSIIIITMSLNISGLILVESALSFLGFGVQPPASSWGAMLSDSQNYFTKGPYLVIGPGILIMTTVLCLFIIGDGFRDAFDPKLIEKP